MGTHFIFEQRKPWLNVFLAIVVLATATMIGGCVTTRHEAPADNASQLYNKGLRFFNKGRYQDAKEVFHQYIADYTNTHLYAVSLYYLGSCYQKLNDPLQARSIYHKVIDENEGDFWAYMAKTRLTEMEEGR